MLYYRNSQHLMGFNTRELTMSGMDSAAFFNGGASGEQKQDVFDKLVFSAKRVVSPLRSQGYIFDIGRSYSEGAINHGTGYALDLVPHSKRIEDAYALAIGAKQLKVCSQIWIEASDDLGNFHVHVRVDPTGYNADPQLYTIRDVKATKVTSGLNLAITDIRTYEEQT